MVLTWPKSPETPGSPEQSMLGLKAPSRAAPRTDCDPSSSSSSSTDSTASDRAAAATGEPRTDQQPTVTPGLNKHTRQQVKFTASIE